MGPESGGFAGFSSPERRVVPTYPLERAGKAPDALPMFVRCKRRFKDGKEHRYWSVAENVRVRGRRVVQRHVLYLGEINDSQRAAWCRSIEVVEGKSRSRQMALFPGDRDAPALTCEVVKIADDTLYRCLDKLPEHKQDFFSFLRARWATLFGARFDALLYDLTSTCFESDPPFDEKRRFG